MVEWKSLVQRLHDSPVRLVLATTGGGLLSGARLEKIAGASRTVLDIRYPYSQQALVDFLGREPDQYCSQVTALDMASRAYELARRLDPDSLSPNLYGVGCTASLATDREKKGEHRAHIAVHGKNFTRLLSVILQRIRPRAIQQEDVAETIVGMVAAAYEEKEVYPYINFPCQKSDFCEVRWPIDHPFVQLQSRQIPAVLYHDGACTPWTPESKVRTFLSGSFNPLHDGHREMVAYAKKSFGPVAYELSLTNTDKPPINYIGLNKRLASFIGGETIVFTNAPTFAEKSNVFSDATFLVGMDTATRIGNPRYYGGESLFTQRAIDTLYRNNARFLVFPRPGCDSKGIDKVLSELCSFANDFKPNPISSTELRNKSA